MITFIEEICLTGLISLHNNVYIKMGIIYKNSQNVQFALKL